MKRSRTRRSPRLVGYDYCRLGPYFVTVCTACRECVFGEVVDGVMRRSALGEVAHEEWGRTLDLRLGLVPDVFVVMPNHVHLLFGLIGDDPAPADAAPGNAAPTRRDTMHGVPTPTVGETPSVKGAPGERAGERRFGQHVVGSVSSIVGAYKAAVTRRARRGGLWHGGPLWQARFHDRIVRNDREADRVRRYVAENPERWAFDRLHP